MKEAPLASKAWQGKRALPSDCPMGWLSSGKMIPLDAGVSRHGKARSVMAALSRKVAGGGPDTVLPFHHSVDAGAE
ncbi:hypothetical protein GCM10010082_06490 [Kushneria pakistanensis]|uniref:Uncharacterized protein n=1 Tax=Kushneria pakistanensis TaxID=1508770 RepID=A0ABQ3FC88_9GAMM|nr:hypothetical protein GCM10010082_06490 [Kushneria pakistanensis]